MVANKRLQQSLEQEKLQDLSENDVSKKLKNSPANECKKKINNK